MPEPRLTLDSMHGRLARKLRLYGLDVEYYSSASDENLLGIASREGRILVTSDEDLWARADKVGVHCILLKEEAEEKQIAAVLTYLGQKRRLTPSASRCPKCNGNIASVSRDEVRGLVHAKVFDNQEEFYRCLGCGQIYWKGTHWKRLTAMAAKVEHLLKGG